MSRMKKPTETATESRTMPIVNTRSRTERRIDTDLQKRPLRKPLRKPMQKPLRKPLRKPMKKIAKDEDKGTVDALIEVYENFER